MLGGCLYLLTAFKMGPVTSLCSSIIYGFSLICRLSVAFLKTLFSSSDTKCSSDMMFSFSSARAILFLIFYFLRIKVVYFSRLYIFLLLSETSFGFIFSKYALCSVLYNLLQQFSCVSYISLEFGVLFWKYYFSSYDLLILAFLSTFVTYNAWLARSNL